MKRNAMYCAITPALATLCATAGAQALPDRSSLPLPEVVRPTYTEIDARDAKMPPRADVKAPKDAPVVEAIGAEAKSRFTGRIPKLSVEVK